MKRILTFDYLRGMAIICVVIMHSTLADVQLPQDILGDCFLHNLVIVGVPVFFFISGYFLLSTSKSTFGAFFSNRIVRIYMPAVFWTFTFWLLSSLLGQVHGFDFTHLAFSVIQMTDPGQYYFVFVLVLLLGAGYAGVIHLEPGPLKVVVVTTLIVNLITIAIYEFAIWLLPTSSLWGVWMYRDPLVWMFFFVYGHYVRQTDPTMTKGWYKRFSDNWQLGLGLAAGSWLITSLETWHLYDKLAPGGQDYFKIASFLYELIVLHYLTLLAQRIRAGRIWHTGLLLLARYSFFIYLIHLPTIPKLLGSRLLVALSRWHLVYVVLIATLSLVLPMLVALPVKVLKGSPRLYLGVARLVGLPAQE